MSAAIKQSVTYSGVKTARKALIVDESKLEQLILNKILAKDMYEVCTVSTGNAAVEIFSEFSPDIVFMNLSLPDTTGYELTKVIKGLSGEKYIPVLLLTGTNDDELLEKCLQLGGDDFIRKPIKESLLKAKSDSLLRVKKLHDDLLLEKEVISRYSEGQLKDLYDADSVIHNIHRPRFYDSGNLEWSYLAQNILSGDIVCSALDPSGTQVILVGDNTGHGLPAAIGSILTCETFYSMVSKGFDINIIVEEINKKLCHLLPSDRFLAAAIMEFDVDYKSVNIWNAGIPSVLTFDHNKNLKSSLPSMHLPLGIVDIRAKDIVPIRVDLEDKDRVYAYTDGLTEVFNDANEIYGEERLVDSIKLNFNEDRRVDFIIHTAKKYRGNRVLDDDLLLIEVDCDKSKIKKPEIKKKLIQQIKPMKWNVHFDLETEVICKSNPVPIIIQALVDMQGFSGHREKIFLIMTEMYSNSLEHGILQLDSSIKAKQNGFHEYYVSRQNKLDELQDGKILINVANFIEDGKGVISITIEDSGEGFDYKKVIFELKDNLEKSGRGIALLRDLCRKCEYSQGGRKLNVEYEWQQENIENVA